MGRLIEKQIIVVYFWNSLTYKGKGGVWDDCLETVSSASCMGDLSGGGGRGGGETLGTMPVVESYEQTT